MIAILLAPVYLLANYYLLRRVMGWVKAWFPFFRTARHWALPWLCSVSGLLHRHRVFPAGGAGRGA